jgi:hypothetical protein
VETTDEYGYLGDAGKFAPLWGPDVRSDDVLITVDDDLEYHPCFVREALLGLQRHSGCVVGFHGAVYKTPITNYYGDRVAASHCTETLVRDTPVNVLGTGVMAMTFDTAEKMDLTRPGSFPSRNMADVHVAVAAFRSGTPMWCLKRSEPMVKLSEEIDHERDTIYAWEAPKGAHEQTRRINEAGLQPPMVGVR